MGLISLGGASYFLMSSNRLHGEGMGTVFLVDWCNDYPGRMDLGTGFEVFGRTYSSYTTFASFRLCHDVYHPKSLNSLTMIFLAASPQFVYEAPMVTHCT